MSGYDAGLIRTLMVAPDVWTKLQAAIPSERAGGGASIHGIAVVVNEYLAPGTMVPLDKDGMPIPKRVP